MQLKKWRCEPEGWLLHAFLRTILQKNRRQKKQNKDRNRTCEPRTTKTAMFVARRKGRRVFWDKTKTVGWQTFREPSHQFWFKTVHWMSRTGMRKNGNDAPIMRFVLQICKYSKTRNEPLPFGFLLRHFETCKLGQVFRVVCLGPDFLWWHLIHKVSRHLS